MGGGFFLILTQVVIIKVPDPFLIFILVCRTGVQRRWDEMRSDTWTRGRWDKTGCDTYRKTHIHIRKIDLKGSRRTVVWMREMGGERNQWGVRIRKRTVVVTDGIPSLWTTSFTSIVLLEFTTSVHLSLEVPESKSVTSDFPLRS